MSHDGDIERRTDRPASDRAAQETGVILGGPLGTLTRGLAFIGGLFLLIAAVITLVSVIGRYGFGRPVPGDYELVELTCAVGVFLFFPYTHAISGNITAEFFTAGLSERRRRMLDIASDFIFTLVALLLTWRLSIGLLDKYDSGETTILIRIPLWWPFSVAVASMTLLTLVCLMRTVAGFGSAGR